MFLHSGNSENTSEGVPILTDMGAGGKGRPMQREENGLFRNWRMVRKTAIDRELTIVSSSGIDSSFRTAPSQPPGNHGLKIRDCCEGSGIFTCLLDQYAPV